MVARIPDQFVQDVLSRVNIVDVISSRVQLKKAGANYMGCCPFHNEKTPSFSVNTERQFYHCFGCGVSGDAIQFLKEIEGLHFTEAVESLAGTVGLEMPTSEEKPAERDYYQQVYKLLQEASVFFQQQLKSNGEPAVNYLKKRGITGVVAKQFGLGYAPPGWHHMEQLAEAERDILVAAGLSITNQQGRLYDRFRERVVFPIRDARGRVIGFGGRVIGDGEPKYLNSPETCVFHKGEELYGIYEARKTLRKIESLIVVEGYLDVIALAQFEIPNAVATLGTALTTQHIQKLFSICNQITLCFDGDQAGQRASWRAFELLLPLMDIGRKVKFLILPNGSDPDTFLREQGRDNFLHQLKRAPSLPDFFIQHLAADLDLSHIDGRLELISKARPLLSKLTDTPLRPLLIERVAELAGVETKFVMSDRSQQQPIARPVKVNTRKPVKPISLAKKAVAIILWHREFLDEIGDLSALEGTNLTGVAFLLAVMRLLMDSPQLSLNQIGAALPEELMHYWIPAELKGILHSIPENGRREELLGAIQRLKEQARFLRMEELLAKAKMDELTADEKLQLQQLLRSEIVESG